MGQTLQTLAGAAGIASATIVTAQALGVPRRASVVAGSAAGFLAATDGKLVQRGLKGAGYAAVDLCAQQMEGDSQMAPPMEHTSLGDGLARPNPIQQVLPSEGSPRAEEERHFVETESLSSQPERPTEEVNMTEKEDFFNMIPTFFEQSIFQLENLTSFGFQVLGVLIAGLIYPWLKPSLEKWALHIRPHSALLYKLFHEFIESPFLNHGPGIRLFCCFLLFVVFVLIKTVTGT
jgi:hypothetical protein